MKQKFSFNIWDFISWENANSELDKHTKEGHIATDIEYKCLSISDDGTLTLEANYTPEKY